MSPELDVLSIKSSIREENKLRNKSSRFESPLLEDPPSPFLPEILCCNISVSHQDHFSYARIEWKAVT